MTGRRSHGRLSALNGVVHQGIYVQVLLDFLKLRQHFLIISGPDLALKCCQH